MDDDHIQAVLWDMDGVLVDTAEQHFEVWQQVLAENGIAITREQFARTFGMDSLHTLQALIGPHVDVAWAREIEAVKEERWRQTARGRIRLLPGAREWLERLRALGIRQALATSAPPENMRAVLDAVGVAHLFDALVCLEGRPGKPNPDIFLEAARQLGASPARCVVIEDAAAGVQAARSAGMRVIAVATTTPPEALAAADRVVANLEALPNDALLFEP